MVSAGVMAPTGLSMNVWICPLVVAGSAPGGDTHALLALHVCVSEQSASERHWMHAVWLSQKGLVASAEAQLASVRHTRHSPRPLLAAVSQKSVLPGADKH